MRDTVDSLDILAAAEPGIGVLAGEGRKITMGLISSASLV
jgi:hypothetical protein